jgi:SAM-dependent methyltransferase
MPSIDELSSFYPENYHSFVTRGILLKARHRLRLKNIRSFISAERPRILDYGCGDGSFILEAAQCMPKATFYGYEISDKKEAKTLLDGRVIIIKGSFEDMLAQFSQCDLITMNHVIEHLPDPSQVLCALYDKLARGGIIEGQTPASDSLEHKIFKTQWSGFHAPRHTVIFSRKGLKEILRRAQFAEIKISGAFNPAGIAVSLASLMQGNSPGRIVRKGVKWLFYLGLATALYPIDLLSGQPGVVNFSAKKISNH